MPTPSEYAGLGGTPLPTQPAATPDGTSQPALPSYCADLESLFQQSPELRASFNCTLQTETTQLVDECDALVAATVDKIRADLDACIQPCLDTYEQCNMCVKGAMQRDADLIQTVDAKCQQKISDQLLFIWHDLVAAMNKIGIPPLTVDEINTVMSGGDLPLPLPPVADVPVDYSPTPVTDGTTQIPTVTPIYTGPITSLEGTPITTSAPVTTTPTEPIPTTDGTTPTAPYVGSGPVTGTTQYPVPTTLEQAGLTPPKLPTTEPTAPVEQASIYVLCANSPGVPVQQYVTSASQIPEWIRLGYSVLAGPFPNSSDGGQAASQWINSNPGIVTACVLGTNPPGPTSPAPPLPPTPTCQQCQAGYTWGTDANGNPVCKPSCQCPVCPSAPQPPTTQPPAGPSQPPTETAASPPGLCGPGDRGLIETWVQQAATSIPTEGDYQCKDGIGSFLLDFIKSANPFSSSPGAQNFWEHFGNTMECFGNWTYLNFIKNDWPTGNCDIRKASAHYIANLVPAILDKLFGIIPPQVKQSFEQRGNYLCQYKTPSTDDVNTAWVHGVLTNEEWEFGVKINGDCVDWQRKLIESSYATITWQDAFRLKRLGKIGGNEFVKWLQRNGVNTDKDQDTFEKAYDQYPALGDLIRMMVRDVADENAVLENGFDNEFNDKFTGQLKQWADAQGVTEDIAKMYWRAHWQLPSPGQLYEMLHRLRETDRDKDDPYKDIVVTADDVESTLKQNDMAPAWVKPLMAISFQPLSRVDVRRGYEVGALDRDGVFRAYLDRGYNEQNAKVLTDFTVLTSAPVQAKTAGAMSLSELASAFNDRIISDQEYNTGIKYVVGSDARAASIYENQLFKREIKERKAIVTANRRRFMTGEFTQAKAVEELIGFGIDLDSATAIVTLWKHELAAKYKGPTVAMLCDWWQRGMITLDDYLQRVKNIGYSQDDAMRIVTVCGMKKNEQLAKEYAAAQKKQQTADEKRRKAIEKAMQDAMPCRPTKPKCPQPGTNGKSA